MKLLHKIFFTAGVLVSLIGCQKENNQPTAADRYQLSAVTTASQAGKTNIESDLSVSWSATGEVMKFIDLTFYNTATEVSEYDSDSKYTISQDGKIAKFNFDIEKHLDAEGYIFGMLYPAASYYNTNTETSVVTANVTDTQTPSANSADPAACLTGWTDGLVWSYPETIEAGMSHLVSYGRMTVKNCPIATGEKISKVEFQATGKAIAGELYWNMDQDEVSAGYETVDEITVLTDNLDCSGDFTVWFSCIPFYLEPSEEIVVNVISDKNTYSRKITLSKQMDFVEGQVAKFSVDMSGTAPASKKYTKVTTAPGNWEGKYLIVVESKNLAFTGVSSSSNWGLTNAVVISEKKEIEASSNIDKYAVTIEKSSSSYKIKVNDGKYMNWTGRDFSLGTSGQEYEISLDNNSNALINKGNYYLKYNAAGGLRAYGKDAMVSIQLYKASDGGGGGTGEATGTVTIDQAYNVTSSSAYVAGGYSGVTSDGKTTVAPDRVYVKYGTSASALSDTEEYLGEPTTGSGSIGVQLYGLSADTRYYYLFVIEVGDKEFCSTTSYFDTESGGGGGDYYQKSWLAGYEVPATTVTLTDGVVNYNGRYCHSTVSETHGNTKACIYKPSSSSQKIVTHTFSYNSKIQRTYTILYDKDKKCALWCAFAMNKGPFPDKSVSRNDSWKYDPAIDQSWQPDLSKAYSGNYSRGHQVASEDRQTSIDQNKQTFYFSNMTPQSQSLNGGTWNVLEGEVQKEGYACSGYDTLYVVTGPVFQGYFKTTTDRNNAVCAIPTHYYKCTMRCSFDASGKMTAAEGHGYLFLHDGTNAPRQNKSIDEIEKLTGFDFFANVPDDLEAAAEK